MFPRIRQYRILWTSAECGRVIHSRLLTVTNDSRKYPTVPDDFRGPSAVTRDLPVIFESPAIEPLVPVAMVRAVPLEEPTILEVLARRILDQTVNCGEKSQKVTGFQSTVPINPSTGSGSATSGKPPDIEGALRQLISRVMRVSRTPE